MICKQAFLRLFARRTFTNDLSATPFLSLLNSPSLIQKCNSRFQSIFGRYAGCCYQPSRGFAKKLTFSYSGDLGRRKSLDSSAPVYHFKNPIEKLDQVPDLVQKLSSLEYSDGRSKKYHRLEEMYDRIENLFGSNAVLEQRVAKLTVDIRNLIPHCMHFRQDKMVKAKLVEKIQMRKKLLKYLRRDDYQRFMWLLRELRIRYVPIPQYNGRITRKYRRKRAVVRAAFEERKGKLIKLREQLEAERVKFEEYKAKTLAQIEEDIQALDLDRSLLEKQQTRKAMTKLEAKVFSRKLKPVSQY